MIELYLLYGVALFVVISCTYKAYLFGRKYPRVSRPFSGIGLFSAAYVGFFSATNTGYGESFAMVVVFAGIFAFFLVVISAALLLGSFIK